MASSAISIEKASGYFQSLVEVLPSADELEKLCEHLRLLRLEIQTGGLRPRWASLEAGLCNQAGEDVACADAAAKTAENGEPEAPPGLALEEREGLGRVLVATKQIAMGEPLFCERPLLVIPGCSLGAQAVGAHGPIMTELAKRRPGQSLLDLDVVCQFFESKPDALSVLRKLESHSSSEEYAAGSLADEVAALALAKGILTDSAREADLARFIRIVAVNAHTIQKIGGVALFFWLSMLSHSCAPNATYSRTVERRGEADTGDPTFTAVPRALRRIEPGEVVSMSYLNLTMLSASSQMRQELLRVQKNFVCACDRCAGCDLVRRMPCPGRDDSKCSGFCVPTPIAGPASTDPLQATGCSWQCCRCRNQPELASLPLQQEEKLSKFLLDFEIEDEQTAHSLLLIVEQDLGNGGGHAQHFLWAWVTLGLMRTLAKRLIAGQDDKGRLAARAAAVLWQLYAWLRDFVPGCLHLLAMESAVPIVRALVAAHRLEEAAQVSSKFECVLAASVGFEDSDVRLFSDASAMWRGSPSYCRPLGNVPDVLIVQCDACGARLVTAASRDGRNGDAAGESQMGTRCSLAEATWCARCGLAPFCGPACEAAGAARHAAQCINADGHPPEVSATEDPT